MNIAEFKNAIRPPIAGDCPTPVLTTEDILLAAYRLKQKYGISCIKGLQSYLRIGG